MCNIIGFSRDDSILSIAGEFLDVVNLRKVVGRMTQLTIGTACLSIRPLRSIDQRLMDA